MQFTHANVFTRFVMNIHRGDILNSAELFPIPWYIQLHSYIIHNRRNKCMYEKVTPPMLIIKNCHNHNHKHRGEWGWKNKHMYAMHNKRFTFTCLHTCDEVNSHSHDHDHCTWWWDCIGRYTYIHTLENLNARISLGAGHVCDHKNSHNHTHA